MGRQVEHRRCSGRRRQAGGGLRGPRHAVMAEYGDRPSVDVRSPPVAPAAAFEALRIRPRIMTGGPGICLARAIAFSSPRGCSVTPNRSVTGGTSLRLPTGPWRVLCSSTKARISGAPRGPRHRGTSACRTPSRKALSARTQVGTEAFDGLAPRGILGTAQHLAADLQEIARAEELAVGEKGIGDIFRVRVEGSGLSKALVSRHPPWADSGMLVHRYATGTPERTCQAPSGARSSA